MQGECVFESNGKQAESGEENYLGILNIQMISLGGIHFVSLGFLYYFDVLSKSTHDMRQYITYRILSIIRRSYIYQSLRLFGVWEGLLAYYFDVTFVCNFTINL